MSHQRKFRNGQCCFSIPHVLCYSYLMCQWYFSRPKSSLLLDVSGKARQLLQHHLGSVFRLSLQCTLIAPLALLIDSTHRLLRRLSQLNPAVRFLIALFHSCFSVHRQFLRFAHPTACIQLAMWSLPLPQSQRHAYFLLFRHRAISTEFTRVQAHLFSLLRLNITLLSSLPLYAGLRFLEPLWHPHSLHNTKEGDLYDPQQNFQNYLVPLLAGVFLTHRVSCLLLSPIHMATHALLHCYLMDTDMFTGQ